MWSLFIMWYVIHIQKNWFPEITMDYCHVNRGSENYHGALGSKRCKNTIPYISHIICPWICHCRLQWLKSAEYTSSPNYCFSQWNIHLLGKYQSSPPFYFALFKRSNSNKLAYFITGSKIWSTEWVLFQNKAMVLLRMTCEGEIGEAPPIKAYNILLLIKK